MVPCWTAGCRLSGLRLQGFEWYDTVTTTILSNGECVLAMSPHHSPAMRRDTEQQWYCQGLTQVVPVNVMPPSRRPTYNLYRLCFAVTFENYKYKQYTSKPADWWNSQTPHAFRMLSHSDQFKPGAHATQHRQTDTRACLCVCASGAGAQSSCVPAAPAAHH